MAIRIQIPARAFLVRILFHPVGRVLLAGGTFLLVAGLILFAIVYTLYSREIDEKLAIGPFRNASRIYAAPHIISLGDPVNVEELVSQLRKSATTG